ncbi:MAG: SH3 domain-containing protein [Clostridiaceae bacterium]|uniref:SH3 domain-containing protein n=2 Tax=Clostridium TaxID=1485 RepID=A0A7X2NI40_9CLOT|nr:MULTISPECIES: SH3 domain-containing protein [Clostridium]MCI6139475.1 SH3 domain-containing protein [Clostridium sp.]MDU3396850.1 SH3 domain-containing protein [Clostridiales bacterium]MDY3231745.1 SH3 domain-containing protein [Clostridiaceae bacterium]MSS35181.1 SH3 domain-containing protein [Clostridium porci]
MKGKKYKKALALALGLMLAVKTPASFSTPFRMMDSYAYTGAATVKATSLNVRSGAGINYPAVGRLAAGAAITIAGEQTGADGKLWYQIQFAGSGGTVKTGFVSSEYVRLPVSYTPDPNFEAYLSSQGFPESYKNGLRQLHAQYPNWVFKARNTGLDWNTVIENESLLGRNLVAAGSVSSWKSVEAGAYNWDNSVWTGLDGSNWVAASSDIIRYYMDPRNFLDETYVFQFLSHEYDANTQTIEGLNSLVAGTFLSGTTTSTGTEGSNFSGSSGGTAGPGGGPGVSPAGPSGNAGSPQSSAYDDSQHGPGVSGPAGSGSPASQGSKGEISLEGPQASILPRERNLVASGVSLVGPGGDLAGSTEGAAPAAGTGEVNGGAGGSSPYINIIMNAGAQSGVSPYVLAAMILQEQGSNGTSPLISGSYPGYEGYYNFFNVEAYQSGSMTAIQMGLRYASQSGSYGRPWNTVEKSILGGAQNYGDNYVKAGQNTFYLKKFNVQGENLYKHQYMSNIQGAASEAAKLAQAYTPELKKTALEFQIPVYSNMPEQACAAPTGDGSPNNKLAGLGVDGFSLTPSFHKDTQEYNLIVDTSVTSLTVSASALDSNASVSGTGTIAVPGGGTDIIITVTAQNGSARNYMIHVAVQAGGSVSGSAASPGGGSSGPGSSGGPADSSGNGPGGSNVTIVEVQS